ncbi:MULTISPECIES: GntR family transcriptional regulator [unclassified Janthinobacterium]|uniref:GntR family transcriptional regulator n=1 Tax=unclassified Janthinobacterium TaxID=2610881 RepID=UPI0025B11422|nr:MULTISPECIES: GntR family transcriptional regulator [unclassified Janthinobacterium]MDN2702111.1 GntR family transcriptional regulator [Janthinobacterium sp. SUN100]MDO8037797.1 GntR family transcriptional regulator [Janthinobacterium sp. SUN137]
MNSASSNLTNNATAASGAVSPTAGTPATPVAAAASIAAAPVASVNTTAATAVPAPAANASPTFSPLYQQIKALITQSLQSGEWKPGELIPSEVELAGRFKVSQGTVRKAIDELAAENLVMRRQGKGTFVSTHHEARAHFRFLRLVPDEGVPHYPESKFIEVKRVRAPADVARLMDLKSGDAVIFIKRVQYFDGVPTIVEELWLPGLIFKGLTAERLVEYKGPMYGLFETEFGTRMIRASEQIRAVCADAGAAQLLNIDLGTPLLSSERVSFTYGDKPVELRRGLYLTSRHHYQNELS